MDDNQPLSGGLSTTIWCRKERVEGKKGDTVRESQFLIISTIASSARLSSDCPSQNIADLRTSGLR